MKIILMVFIFIPQLYITGILCYTGMTFLLNNDLEDDLQGMLLNTIGLVFVLELDTLIYDAFTSQQKKQQLSSLSFPSFLDKGMMRVILDRDKLLAIATLPYPAEFLMCRFVRVFSSFSPTD